MKISKVLIRKCADRMIRKRGVVSQIDVQKSLEECLHRELTSAEKARVTQILRYTYVYAGVKIDTRSKRRVEYFE